ncbi:peptidoglycan glycolsyltranferase FtsI [gamma proteobacterium HTCC5015]|nr:peptidoglycan glycolsyltranferase FtsI [gamma proteobacterium HTCC5015]
MWRRRLVLGALAVAGLCLVGRAVQLQVLDREFYVGQGDARQQRTVPLPAHRGMIVDRNGQPLAMSTPVDSVWVNPKDVLNEMHRLPELARILDVPAENLAERIARGKSREFVYLKRHLPPHIAQAALDLEVPGVSLQREYRRYYPTGEVSGHLLGFTNIDDVGQEGLELAFNDWLSGKEGAKRILQDRLGQTVSDLGQIEAARPGRDLALSIDRRVQYLAYRVLKSTVQKYQANAGSVVLLDATTGEVIALANQPGFNPNNRRGLVGSHYRNRAVTDVFEPGSTMKPITVAAALEAGKIAVDSKIRTAPGYLRVGNNDVRDTRDYGVLDPAGVIMKSSNVGAAKIALSMETEYHWDVLTRFGFGQPTGSGFPGETTGYLHGYHTWSEFEQATISFGYGLSSSALQLARAYTVLANDGVLYPVSFQKGGLDGVRPSRVISSQTAQTVRDMMQTVVTRQGTAFKARIPGYTVAGKTGTAYKYSRSGGYDKDRYTSVFAGMAPATNPRFVAVVMIDEPQRGHYGGVVAAPAFAELVGDALRLFDVAPDDLPKGQRLAGQQADEGGAA